MTYSVAVSGASGYAGGEILRILAAHPDIELRTVTAHANAGQPLIQHQPHLRSLAHLTLAETTPEVLAGHDIVFLALPHGQSGQYTDALGDAALVIDAGADHRLTSNADWDRFYGGAFHEPWTYGVPELLVGGRKQRENLVGATRIAAPGLQCEHREPEPRAGRRGRRDRPVRHRDGPRRGALGRGQEPQDEPPRERDPRQRQPLRRRRDAPAHPRDPAGARAAARAPRSDESTTFGSHARFDPISVQSSEERATDASAAGPSTGSGHGIRISFTPVIVPMARGILATSSAPIAPGASDDDIRGAWEAAYGDETFVQLLPAGQFPRTADVLGANTALLGLAIDRDANRVTVVAAVDNLVKGTAGAAVQSMNLALGLPEGRGLTVNGVAP